MIYILNDKQYVQLSLINNLFYLRTMRYFCINIELSFYKNNESYSRDAAALGEKCEELSRELIKYLDYNLLRFALASSILVTKYTLRAEELTEKLFDINIDTGITEQELAITPDTEVTIDQNVVDEIGEVNQKAYVLTQNFITFCNEIKNKLNTNNLFSYSFPSIYNFMIEEVDTYRRELNRLIRRDVSSPIFVLNFEYRFNEVMRDIATFIRSLVDPIHTEITSEADIFIERFQNLVNEYKEGPLSPERQKELTEKSLDTLNAFRTFIERCIEGQLSSSLYFNIEPTFLDNLYTEANYFKYGLTLNKAAEELF